MEKATLTISLPRRMKAFIETKLGEGRFSTPSEYIRSLIRVDQDLNGQSEIAALVHRVGTHILPPRHDDAAGRKKSRTVAVKSVVTSKSTGAKEQRKPAERRLKAP